MTKSEDAAAAEEKVNASATDTSTKKSKGKNKKAFKGAVKGTAKKGKDKPKDKSKDKKAATKKAAAPKKPAAERDEFGFRKGSKKSEAAKLYAAKKGATLAEVKDKTGSSQLNLLKELEDKGVKIARSKEAGEGKKQVTRYKIESGGKSSKKDK